jgi:hypothetical protein
MALHTLVDRAGGDPIEVTSEQGVVTVEACGESVLLHSKDIENMIHGLLEHMDAYSGSRGEGALLSVIIKSVLARVRDPKNARKEHLNLIGPITAGNLLDGELAEFAEAWADYNMQAPGSKEEVLHEGADVLVTMGLYLREVGDVNPG